MSAVAVDHCRFSTSIGRLGLSVGLMTSTNEQSILNGDVLGAEFHGLYRSCIDLNRKKAKKKKSKKKVKQIKGKDKQKTQIDGAGESSPAQPPVVELCSNPSSFAVFAGVRQSVLEKHIRDAAEIFLVANTCHLSDSENDEECNDEKTIEALHRIPKIVGIGLCSVFELIRESRTSHPSLCTLALEALLDILQGQQPEGLKTEPADVIDSLFNLLLELASQPLTENKKNAASSWLTSVACSCLLSLVVARGDTGKLLNATAAMIMSEKVLACECLKMPYILTALQRSIHAVLLGKTIIPDWITNGILKKAQIDTFSLNMLEENGTLGNNAMASDGCFLYIHSSPGILLKFGTGYGMTIRGHLYAQRSNFYPNDKGWLGIAEGRLFYKPESSYTKVIILDTSSLKEIEDASLELNGKEVGPSVMFSDGENIGTISSAKDDSFVVRTFNAHASQMPCISELPLKLARKCLDLFGWATFDEEIGIHTITTTFDDEPIMIAAGKEFALLRTTSGKVLFSGKAQSLGIKQGGPTTCHWVELPITKSPKIVQFSVGHEGLHALLTAEDGGVFFVGLARRGEDGDQNKGRRQPKPVKPKKMIKVEALNIVFTACNNGTSALITKDGELYMFGKDAAHCHHSSGLVTDLKDVSLTQVALGKAHVVALSSKGHVYTFGINNKGQCGRDFASHTKDAVMSVAMATANEDEVEDEELDTDEPDVMCPPGQHKWRQDECMVCTICGECTGFGVSCISKGQPDRNPGLPCGCGWGDSGCAECGCCKTCAGEEKVVGSILAAEFDIIMRRRPGNRLQDQIQKKLEERRHRHKAKTNNKSLKAHVKNIRAHMVETPQEKGVVPSLVEEIVSSDQEKEASKIASLAPARVTIPGDYVVSQIACGLHHSVLLLQNGEVFTFGSNQHGQLGVGDLTPRGMPSHVRLPTAVTHIAAGSNHTVILTSAGLVYTFGSYQKGQLGRSPPPQSYPEENRKEKFREAPWFALPGLVPNIGPKYGRRPTWVGASGDQTFLKIDESLINAHNLTHSTVVANKSSICLIPNTTSSFKCLLINKGDGNCRNYSNDEQVDLSDHCVCIDPAYNVIWSLNPISKQVNCYNVVAAEACGPSLYNPINTKHSSLSKLSQDSSTVPRVPHILTPMLATPIYPRYQVTRSQVALHLLSCLDTLAMAQELHWKVQEDEIDHQCVMKIYNKDDFATVNRFESHGGGWGYSGHSVEAIRFMADSDILLGGFGLFGGRGDYIGKIKLFDIGMEGGEQEIDGELVAETEEIPYECGARQRYPVLFDEPIPLQANRWYVAWARVSGPSSDCGSSGQCVVTTEDQVAFYFKSSKKSNNGTDVNAGQIPQLLYKVVTHESQATHYRSDVCEPVYVLSREFSMSVTPDCLHSLLLLLDWSWMTFKASLSKLLLSQDLTSLHLGDVLDLDRLVYISCSTLRLLRTYINEVYPNNVVAKKNIPEATKLVESVIDTRCLLRRILSDPLPIATPSKSMNNHIHKPTKENIHEMSTVVGKAITILEECHSTFVACFHAFYPTPGLKWLCLCDLLVAMESDPVKAEECDRLLAAILASLCCPTVKLTSILPIVWERDESSPHKQNSLAGTNLEITGTDVLETKYPVLVEHMLHKSRLEDSFKTPYMFQEVLNCLLAIVVRPIQHALGYEKTAPSSKLVFNTCRLLAAIVAELTAQSIGLDADLHSSNGRVLHVTPTRFTRVSQSRTWNTGNGSPDAICFSVDRPGIVIVGATLYGGVGSYDYELELLDDQNGSSSDPSHTQRWNSLEIVRGTFGPDDCVGDVVEVKFEHYVHIKENIKYALRLRNHGGRTSNGDGGLNSVKGPDGTTFSFSTCSLSFNGTNHTRGQLPQLLYYSTPQDSDNQQSNRAMLELQARKNALLIASSVVKVATTLLLQARDEADEKIMEVLATAHVTSMLLPMIFAHIAPLATSDPRSAVQVLEMIQNVLPPVAYLNNSLSRIKTPPVLASESTSHDINLCTTSNHYAIVESDHPYKPATVSNYKVSFPDTVKWMSLEFDPQCGTAQAEDALQLYIPSQEGLYKTPLSSRIQDDEEGLECPYWPVLHKYSGNGNWSKSSLVLPGNEVVFSLETASDYVKDDKACFYGFKCLVVGYDCTRIFDEGLRRLEEELAYLGGMCASSLMRKDLLLPPASVDEMEDDLDIVDDIAQQIYGAHPNILGKGFALSHPPSIHQALEGALPFSYLSNERSFLKDFVMCAPGTSGGRLARWLQPDSYIDMKHCEILYNKDEMRCGWPTVVTVVTKDQYEEIVNVPQLKLEVKALPIDKRDHSIEDTNRKVPRMSKPDSLSFGGNPLPNITVPYEVTVKEKMCYYAISMMKSYENYSFEELRYTTPALKRPSENMMVRANNDGTYSCNWTPGSVGWYLIHVCIDGFEIENSRKIEVKEPPQGVTPPLQTLVKKNVHQPNKVKRFVAKFSAGLRVRAHPSLQSEQIGIVPVNGVITFIDEVHNDDGVWVRLSPDAIKKYCHNGNHEAWCLQYNQHLGRTLLVPLEEPKAFLDDSHKDNRTRHISGNTSEDARRQRTGGPGIYHVIKCGASGHNIRSTPNLKAPPVGMLVLGNQLNVVEEIGNGDGLWVKLDKDSMRRFCFNTDGEAWSLAQSRGDVIYLQHENNLANQENDAESSNKSNIINTNAALNIANERSNKSFWASKNPIDAPFDFSSSMQKPVIPSFGSNDSLGIFMFGPSNNETVLPNNSFQQKPDSAAFVFGPSSGSFSKLSTQQTTPPLVPPKPALSERRHLTTPHTKSSVVQKWLRNDESIDHHHLPSRESTVPPELLGVSVKELVKVLGESRANGNEATPPHTPPGTPPRRLSRSSSPKPPIPGVKRESSPIPIPPNLKGVTSTPVDTVGANFATQSVSNSPQLNSSFGSTDTPSLHSHSSQSHHDLTQTDQPSNVSSLRRAVTVIELSDGGLKSFTQTGTQTSPDGSKEHFSIGTNARKEEPIRLSPKLSRKDRAARQLRSKRERAQSPAPSSREPTMKEHHIKEPVKTAMSPLVAECLRAVFSAFLWHEGIVHDAMACASFLKFHPDLPKQLPKVPKHDLTVERPETLSKEQKARLRHSVEVSASNFLTVQSNTAQALARSLANANVNKNKLPKPAETIKEESTFIGTAENKGIVDTLRKFKQDDKLVTSSSTAMPLLAVQSHAVSTELWTVERRSKGDLPPSLQHLLILWEVLTSEILKMMSQQLTAPVIAIPSRALKTSDGKDRESDRRLRKKKEWRLPAVGRGNLFGEAAGGPFGAPERETMCELCGKSYPHPVTYHMRQVHPGCGGHAGGKGYNSGGNFCGGWAGNCGDGGVGGNSWYLICDRCREKYLRQKRQIILKEKTRRNRKKLSAGKLLSPLPPLETHHIMKQNATFLLDLASASGAGMTSHPIIPTKRSSHNGSASVASNMPSLHEDTPLEPSPFPLGSFQCLWTLGAQHMDVNSFSDNFFIEETLRQNRELGTGTKVRSNEDGGVVTLHSLAETDDSDTASNYGSEMLGVNDREGSRGRVFHRSISVGTTTREWNREEGEGRIIMTRKRNKSSGEGIEDGSSLLCHPSSTLTRLVSLVNDKGNTGEILGRPILSFILQRHDLQSLRVAMKQAVRKAACRAYAMQGLNWLIRSVTQPTALHDLLWFFVAALSPQPDPGDEVEDDDGAKGGSGVGGGVAATAVGSIGDKKERRDHDHQQQEKEVAVCDHPLSDITIAGEAVRPLVTAFHCLLQSISDLMMMLPMGSALQMMAMRCWCLKFRQSDHLFLHRSHVFSNISKILSRSEEELCGDGDGMSSVGDSYQSTSIVECLKDLTPLIDLKASSRPGMLGSLLDNSTETFWESGDDDRNKTKTLTIMCSPTSIPKIIYVHIDNCRDLGNKVSNIVFKAGPHIDELVKLRQIEVESRYTGWVSCPFTEGRLSVIRLELKGPDNTLRVRQVKVLGAVENESLQIGKAHSAFVIQQRNCEAETLKVFRLLTSQVFGKLISSDDAERETESLPVTREMHLEEDKAEGSNDLKEHMVGILFSRSKLTHLQKQVCAHIVQAIRKEAARVREEWEALLCSKSLSMEELPKSSDAYCFEMLSMVLALSGSSVGRAYLAQQCSLLKDLLSLLHTGSARVQRQVTSLLRRVLPEVSPQTFGQILGVKSLPPTDYSIVSEAVKSPETNESSFDIHRMGILDVFFSCIAKALTVQMKVKGKETNKGITTVTLATSIHPRDYMGSRWWLRGCITRKLAEVIIQLLQDMATGKLSDAWASITKGAVAENILNLTRLEDRCRSPSDCLKTATLWLALSSLCVLDQDHVERLSSGQWTAGSGDGQQATARPTCDNHDDGETLAIILCNSCGNLCADCDRYLHLHRRTHSHQRQIFKEEEEAIKVDLHEGCGRTKLFWIMALADSKTLKAMVEFREGTKGKSTASTAGTCRFCGTVGDTGLLAIGNVCGDSECQEHARSACIKSLSCGHMCGGIRNELVCLPCLHGCSHDLSLKQDADDMCMICFTEALSCAPAIQLRCGHIFHLHCCNNVLNKKWAGPRITFGFSLCPICKCTIDHPVLKELLDPIRALYEDVKRKALMRLEYEGLHKADAISIPGARFFNDPASYAMERYAYYVCYKCKKAYYGGEARCDIEAGGGDEYDPTELVCGACSDVSRAQMCPKHGTDFLEYKCRYCCSVAVFFCFGTTHFCNACHDDFQHVTNIPKNDLPHCPAGPKGKQLEGEECPLHVQHPPTGEEFALGCGVCRNAHTF